MMTGINARDRIRGRLSPRLIFGIVCSQGNGGISQGYLMKCNAN
jgi:hypothetical protein